MADVYSHNQEQQVKKLKRLLEGWRIALLPLKSVFLWEQQWYPCAIFASVSVLYTIIWLMDLNFLTAIAVMGLVLNFLDFIVPVVCNSLCNPNAWTGQKEKMFEDTCKGIVSSYNKMLLNIYSFCSLRESSPLLYYVFTITMLSILAFIGSAVNNTFLLYLLTTIMLLWPGLQGHGLFNFLLSLLRQSRRNVKAD